MPKIAELREIDGAIWARIEMTDSDGAVTLWTASEVEANRRAVHNNAIEAAAEHFEAPSTAKGWRRDGIAARLRTMKIHNRDAAP